MKRTTKYGLTYFEKGDYTTSLPEMQRWETLDNQLYALFTMLGNGVLNGWDFVIGSALDLTITAGAGHVNFTAVESTTNITINLIPNATNYIYAASTTDSYWTKNVVMSSSLQQKTLDSFLLLGTAITNNNNIVSTDVSQRDVLGFVGLIQNAVKDHRHIGGLQNPSQINLATDVQGQISQSNLPELDANVIQTGTLDPHRLPLIDHISGLKDQGVLTHSQIDDFISNLSLPNQTNLGAIATTNLLQLILGLKHVYPDIDRFLVNQIAFIPGITPDSYIDTTHTTAIVDTRTFAEGGQHTISGIPSSGFQAYTRIWDSNADFEASINFTQVDASQNVIAIGDSVTLTTKNHTLVIDEFNDISTWSVEILDLSSLPSFLLDTPNGARLNIKGTEVEVALQIKKSFNAQDWSGYDFLVFLINTSSVQHGDLFFYISDAYAGIQNSFKVVLPRNAPTINQDSLTNGWQEVIIDLRGFNRTNINEIGFYVSTQSGWDTSKGFSFNLNNISLSTGNVYQPDGHFYIVYGSDFFYRFWRMRWDSFLPDDILSTGISLQVRTRVSNSIGGLSLAAWSPYQSISEYIIPVPLASMFKYIEIDFYFLASDSGRRAPILQKAYLDFYATDTDSSFEYNKKSDWDAGTSLNIDTQSIPGSMMISSVSEIMGLMEKLIRQMPILVCFGK
jgi:hypothetical protein